MLGSGGSPTMGSYSATPVKVLFYFTTATPTKIAVGSSHAMALLSDGSVYAWGSNWTNQVPYSDPAANPYYSTPTKIYSPATTDIAAGGIGSDSGEGHSCAVSSGALLCWGLDDQKQCGYTAKDKCYYGTLACSKTPTAVTGITTTPVQIALGGKHSCAILPDKTIQCWGDNSAGELGCGTCSKAYHETPVTVLAGW
jgi:alpha-tubulin suppressor-like RCC1 family protein